MKPVMIGKNQRDFYCIMCGAEPGQPCMVISGGDGLSPGDERPTEHFYRGNAERPEVLIPDEPPLRALDGEGK